MTVVKATVLKMTVNTKTLDKMIPYKMTADQMTH